MATISARQFQRRDTTGDATLADPVFASGELFIEEGTGKAMIGDGSSLYSDFDESDKIQSPKSMFGADISTTTPSDKHVLAYNASNTRYENRALTTADLSDLTALFQLGGVSGGQVAYGGTGSGDDLTLHSTTNATKGSVFFGTDCAWDQANSEFGIGIQSGMLAKLHVKTGSSSVTALGASEDDFLVESSSDVGMSLIGGTGGICTIAMGDSVDPDEGMIRYSNVTQSMWFTVNGVQRLKIGSDGGIYMYNLPTGATAAAAGAGANEIWVTSGHATQEDNTLMLG